MTRPKPLVAGNWKMNGVGASLAELDRLADGLSQTPASCDVMICPPATLIAAARARAAGSITIGGQDCSPEPSGAFTGDVSAEMLKDAGASAVIVGHSERRQLHGETDAAVRAKASAARRAGLTAIICVGETLEQRDAGNAVAIVTAQVAASVPADAAPEWVVVAYEPVWAIGTGRTPSPADVEAMHGAIRAALRGRYGAQADGFRLLYGGSVKPANAAELMGCTDVDGALVGGASLKAADFLGIIKAYAT